MAFGNLDPNAYPANKEGCLSCHQGIEPIKDYDSAMAQQIYAMGSAFGDPNGCIICHGGNPNETKDKKSLMENQLKVQRLNTLPQLLDCLRKMIKLVGFVILSKFQV